MSGATDWTPPHGVARPSWWQRQSKLRKGLMIGGGVFVGLAVVANLTADPADEADAVAATTVPESFTEPTVTDAPTTDAPTPTMADQYENVPDEWIDYAEYIAEVYGDMGELASEAQTGVETMDMDTAAQASTEAWALFFAADRPPEGFPAGDLIEESLDVCEEAWDLTSDGLIELDTDKIGEASGLLDDCTASMDNVTEKITAAVES